MLETRLGRQMIRGRLQPYSEAVSGLLSIIAVVVLGLIDLQAPSEIRLFIFYLLIIAFAAWCCGEKTLIAVIVVSALVLLGRESQREEFWGWTSIWNVGTQIGIYVIGGRVISALRILTRDLKWRVSDRTAALQREIVERNQTEEQLLKTLQQLRRLAENLTDVFWIRDSEEFRIGYVNPAYEKIWGRTARELYLHPEVWLDAIHPEDRERMGRIIRSEKPQIAYDQEYRIVRPDGKVLWIRERAFPIRDATGKVVRIAGIAEDTTERRRLEREIIEISDREHAQIGQDLHDGLCQKLIALAFDLGSLEEKLASRGVPEAQTVRQISVVLDESITEARATARVLFPMQLETDGLGSALTQLASTVSSRLPKGCVIECEHPVCITSIAMAMHLYRIAQEAVNNAIKHSGADSVLIQLQTKADRVELRIVDDGKGLSASGPSKDGMGMYIMNYRARMIGGTLSICSGAKCGTVVSCVAPQ